MCVYIHTYIHTYIYIYNCIGPYTQKLADTTLTKWSVLTWPGTNQGHELSENNALGGTQHPFPGVPAPGHESQGNVEMSDKPT